MAQILRVLGMLVLLNIYYIWPVVIGFDNGYGREVWQYPMFTLFWGITSLIPVLMWFSKRAKMTLGLKRKHYESEIGDKACANLYDVTVLSLQISNMVYDFTVSIFLAISSWYIWDYIVSKPGYPGRFKNYVPNIFAPFDGVPGGLPAGTVGSNSIGDIISFLALIFFTTVEVMIVGKAVVDFSFLAYFSHPTEIRYFVPTKLPFGNDEDDYDEY